ncbi:MAG TPA: Gfo/Idh/MocA family oxidoreductase [Chthoniobacteraceae bacterium]|nr:Gfo/Idh/MocA family oxidoreductase [Chthoniobacteraceae bacterium]
MSTSALLSSPAPAPLDRAPRPLRYALCGLSSRGIHHFLLPLLGRSPLPGDDYRALGEVVGVFDLDAERVDAFNRKQGTEIAHFAPEQGVEEMIRETRPDVLLVAGPDHTHCEHALAGLRHGLRVVVEKPLAIRCEEVRAMLKAEAEGAGEIIVTHNYRYASLSRHLKRFLLTGRLGRVTSVEMTYNLDTEHGSSFFFRWNRERAKSGGLSIHKAVHHFDLVSWLIGEPPETVFAFGRRHFYGANGALRPRGPNGEPLSPEATRQACPYFRHHHAPKGAGANGRLKPSWDGLGLPYNAQYQGDAYIYDDAIDIEDTYSAVIAYRGGATLTYASNYSAPWKGYTLAINGTGGRLEATNRTEPARTPHPTLKIHPPVDELVFYPLFGGRELYQYPKGEGSHGGGDPLIRRDLFLGPDEESRRLSLPSNSYDGALAIATGEAVWRSGAEGRPFTIRELLDDVHQP